MAHNNSMLDNMSDSECSDSSENDTSSSAASTNTSDSEQSFQSLEPARILKQNLELPKGLCDNPDIFNEFFSLDTWRCLPDHMKDQLKPFLPNFNDVCTDEKDAQRETNATIQKLFTNQINRFTASPLIDFQRNLEEGNYRPDISRLRANIQKSQRREQRFQQCEHISRMAKTLVVSRERLLRNAYDSTTPNAAKQNNKKKIRSPMKLQTSVVATRAKKRYFEEISIILDDVGLDTDFTDDENYPEGPPPSLARKKRNLGSSQVRMILLLCRKVFKTKMHFSGKFNGYRIRAKDHQYNGTKRKSTDIKFIAVVRQL